MSEILFYHLERSSLEEVLPGLIERSLQRDWRVVVRTESAERAQAIDMLLWTWNEESFLPHAQLGDGNAAAQPVLITVEGGNPNQATVLFLAGGATLDNWNEICFPRVVFLFDARDAGTLSTARSIWKTAKELGHDATYWRQSVQGRWEKQT
jgi:DNA polymerase-3 subunit chi